MKLKEKLIYYDRQKLLPLYFSFQCLDIFQAYSSRYSTFSSQLGSNHFCYRDCRQYLPPALEMGSFSMSKIMDKQTQVVMFSSTAIALYGYDQGR